MKLQLPKYIEENKLEIPDKTLKIYPISAESFGVRSFCIFVTTEQCSLLLDPGCALGPFKKNTIPHPLELKKQRHTTQLIQDIAKTCDLVFISHYHHDHFKPNLDDNIYVYSNNEIFSDIFSNKIVIAKDPDLDINYYQQKRGIKLFKDCEKLGTKIFSARKLDQNLGSETEIVKIYDREPKIYSFKDLNLIFPSEFLHGIHQKAKIYIQPIVLNKGNNFFYYFPDVQGFPDRKELNWLLLLRKFFDIYYHKNINSHGQLAKTKHSIAFGGPIPYIYRNKSDEKSKQILQNSINHTTKVVESFDISIIDHHLLRDPTYEKYWKKFLEAATNQNAILRPFNTEVFSEELSIMEINRKKLFALHPVTNEFKNWANKVKKHKTQQDPPLE